MKNRIEKSVSSFNQIIKIIGSFDLEDRFLYFALSSILSYQYDIKKPLLNKDPYKYLLEIEPKIQIWEEKIFEVKNKFYFSLLH